MQARARRWKSWARQLKERHGHAARRQAAASMVLLRFRNGVAIQHNWRPQLWVTVRAGAGLRVTATQVVRTAAREISQGGQGTVPRSVTPLFGREPAVRAVRREVPPGTQNEKARASATPDMQVVPGRYSAVSADTRGTRKELTVVTESIARQAIRRTQQFEDCVVRTVRREAEHRLQSLVRRNSRREEMPPPMPMVLRPAAAAVQPTAPQASDEHAVHEREMAREFTPAPAININSLTEQVMDQIDRRVVAWRERMGKF